MPCYHVQSPRHTYMPAHPTTAPTRTPPTGPPTSPHTHVAGAYPHTCFCCVGFPNALRERCYATFCQRARATPTPPCYVSLTVSLPDLPQVASYPLSTRGGSSARAISDVHLTWFQNGRWLLQRGDTITTPWAFTELPSTPWRTGRAARSLRFARYRAPPLRLVIPRPLPPRIYGG